MKSSPLLSHYPLPSVDLHQYEARQSGSKAIFSTAAATVALALILAGLGTLSVQQHPAPSPAVVVATVVTILTPGPRHQVVKV